MAKELSLTERYEVAQSRLTELEVSVTQLTQNVTDANTKVAQYSTQVAELTSKVAALGADKAKLEADLATEKAAHEAVKQDFETKVTVAASAKAAEIAASQGIPPVKTETVEQPVVTEPKRDVTKENPLTLIAAGAKAYLNQKD